MSEFKIKLVIWSASESDCIFSMEKKKTQSLSKHFLAAKRRIMIVNLKLKMNC
jgi:predicted protein tyrosine phosphatase